jgi:glyoxylase-like metal-dependent hydrolase (beta-lactamase superfamily II)
VPYSLENAPAAGPDDVPRLWTLGSGSKGNASALVRAGRVLLFDCGYELPGLVERLRAAGLHPWDVDDVVLSHGTATTWSARRPARARTAGACGGR